MRAPLLKFAAENRVLRHSLNSFWCVARGISKSIVPARQRVCFSIAERNPSQIDIRQDGLWADGYHVVDSSFLAESFLEKGITQINLREHTSPQEIIAFTKASKACQTENITFQVDNEKAKELYKKKLSQ